MKTFCKSKSQDLAEKVDRMSPQWSTKVKAPQRLSKEVDGRTIHYNVMKEIDISEEMKKYTPDMFTMENIQDIGAVGQLQETVLQAQTLMHIDKNENGAGKILDEMDADEWARVYLSKKKEEKTNEKTEEKTDNK